MKSSVLYELLHKIPLTINAGTASLSNETSMRKREHNTIGSKLWYRVFIEQTPIDSLRVIVRPGCVIIVPCVFYACLMQCKHLECVDNAILLRKPFHLSLYSLYSLLLDV